MKTRQKTFSFADRRRLVDASVALSVVVALACSVSMTAKAQSAPGGVSSGLTVWYEPANFDATATTWPNKLPATFSPGTLTRLSDTTATSGSIVRKVGAMNFNPALEYTGNAFLGTAANLNRDAVTASNTGSAFGVGLVSDQLLTLSRGGSETNDCGTNRCDVGMRPAATNFGHSGTNGSVAYATGSTNGPTANLYGLWAVTGSTGQTNTRNGMTNTGPAVTKLVDSDYQLRLGSFPGYTYGNPAAQQIAEGLYYNRQLTTAEAQQVSSYLAIKYGITLDADATRNNASNFDYRSTGGAIVWAGNNTLYSGYHANVFGIGRDGVLDQRISTSINGGNGAAASVLDVLTIANGTLAAPADFTYTLQTNAAGTASGNGTALNQGQYLMVGNDNGAVTAVTPTPVSNMSDAALNGSWQRLNRRWRAQNTGAVGTVSLRFQLSAAGVTALGGNLGRVVLLVDDDGTYTNGGTRVVTAGRAVSGNAISFNVTLANAEVFTLASPMTSVVLQKQTAGIAGGPFGFTLVNTTQTSGSVTTAAAGVATQVDSNTLVAGTQSFDVQTIGTDVVITESSMPVGWELADIVCSNPTSPVTFTPVVDRTTNKVTIPGASVNVGATITCTFHNRKPPIPFATCPSNAFVTRGNALSSLNLQTGVFTPIIANMNAAPSSLISNAVNAIGFGKDGYLWGWYNNGLASQLVRMGSDKADLPFGMPPSGMVGAATGFFIADVNPQTGYLVMYSSPTPAGSGGGVVNTGIYILNTATNTWMTSSPVPAGVFADSTDMAFDKAGSYLYSVENSPGKVFRVPWNGGTLGAREDLVTLPLTNGSGGWGAIFLDDRGTMYAYRSGSGSPAVGLIYRIFKTASGTWAYDLLVGNADTSTNLDGASCPAAAPPVTTAALLLRKTTTGGMGGPFGFTLTNASASTATVTTTVAGTAEQVDGDAATNGAQAFTIPTTGTNVTVSESTLPVGWKLSAATTCKNSTGTVVGSLSGTTYTIPASSVVAGEAFECDFFNEALADLYMSKTNGASAVVPGTPFEYTLLVGNKGPAAADGALVHDPAVAGLTCSGAVTCTTTGAATCPAPLTVAALQTSPGLTIPLLPKDSSVTLKMTCTAN